MSNRMYVSVTVGRRDPAVELTWKYLQRVTSTYMRLLSGQLKRGRGSNAKGQIKSKFGIALTALGIAITASLFALFLWVLTRELYLSGNLSFFWQKDFYYILPVFIFLFPGVYFVHIGRKIIRDENIGLMPSIEIAIMLIIGTALIYLNLAADSDYLDQARQTPSAHNELSR